MVDPIIRFEKRCPACSATRPITDFSRNRAKPDGRADHCKSCEARRRREYRATPEGAARHRERVARARARAKERYDAAVAQLSPEDRARLGR